MCWRTPRDLGRRSQRQQLENVQRLEREDCGLRADASTWRQGGDHEGVLHDSCPHHSLSYGGSYERPDDSLAHQSSYHAFAHAVANERAHDAFTHQSPHHPLSHAGSNERTDGFPGEPDALSHHKKSDSFPHNRGPDPVSYDCQSNWLSSHKSSYYDREPPADCCSYRSPRYLRRAAV